MARSSSWQLTSTAVKTSRTCFQAPAEAKTWLQRAAVTRSPEPHCPRLRNLRQVESLSSKISEAHVSRADKEQLLSNLPPCFLAGTQPCIVCSGTLCWQFRNPTITDATCPLLPKCCIPVAVFQPPVVASRCMFKWEGSVYILRFHINNMTRHDMIAPPNPLQNTLSRWHAKQEAKALWPHGHVLSLIP